MNFPVGSIPTQPFSKTVEPTIQQAPVFDEQETSDPDNTQETEQTINPPDDWLQPKVFKGSSVPSSESFSENKG